MVVSLCRLLLAIIFFCRPQNSRTHCVYIHQSSQEARRIWKELVGEKTAATTKAVCFYVLDCVFSEFYEHRSICHHTWQMYCQGADDTRRHFGCFE